MGAPEKQIDYIEFAVHNVAQSKQFYSQVFGWTFVDYGKDYASFNDGRLTGGIWTSSQVTTGNPLVVIYAQDLSAMQQKIVQAGGKITRDTFSFPGGRRFHFADPSGNVLAVWSDQ